MTRERFGAQLPLEARKRLAKRAQVRAISRNSNRNAVDEVWEGTLGIHFGKSLEDWITSKGSWISSGAGKDLNLSGHDMESHYSSGELSRALRSTSGRLTVEAILDRALREVRTLEFGQSISPTLTRTFILEEFIPLLVECRGVGKKRADQLTSRARQGKFQAFN